MQLRMNHVALTVKDIDESVVWYREKLNFKEIHRYKNNEMDIVVLELNTIHLELFSFREKTQPLPQYRADLYSDLYTIGTKHFCIETDNL